MEVILGVVFILGLGLLIGGAVDTLEQSTMDADFSPPKTRAELEHIYRYEDVVRPLEEKSYDELLTDEDREFLRTQNIYS